MNTKDPLVQLTDAGALVARRWVAACLHRMQGRELDPDAAAHFLQAMTQALARPDDTVAENIPADDASRAFEDASRAFAWAAGSTAVAVEQLVVLRSVVQEIVEVVADRARMTVVRAVDALIDKAIVGTVRETVRELERDALVDPLTGLYNRRALNRNLEVEIGRARRQQRPFSIIYIDIDGLKAVNDHHGHAAGDTVLQALSNALTAVLRGADTAYRIGGDEFVILLPETPPSAIPAVLDRIAIEGAPNTTWGSASYPAHGDTPEALLEAADRVLLARRSRRKARPV